MNRCLICFQDVYQQTSLRNYFKEEDIICGECRAKLVKLNQWYSWQNHSIKALYTYNDFMESLLFQFKEGRDVALQRIFFKDFEKEIFDSFKEYTIIYMPSSNAKCKERGFFPLALMLQEIPLDKRMLFKKSRNMKQSSQSLKKRADIHNVIKFIDNVEIPQGKLLLVDDVCTSGNTLKCAFNLLKEHKYEVKALVLSIHQRFVESCD